MAYIITDPVLANQNIADTSTTAKHPLGSIVRAVDPTLGGGEFIYLLGVASTVVGSPVAYNINTWQTSLAPVGANKPYQIAVAMSANGAASYGWYQIAGIAVGAKTSGLALASNAALGILTVGKFAATGSGKEVENALTLAKSTAAGTVQILINRPRMQGRIT
jgi:hypothetical protein